MVVYINTKILTVKTVEERCWGHIGLSYCYLKSSCVNKFYQFSLSMSADDTIFMMSILNKDQKRPFKHEKQPQAK